MQGINDVNSERIITFEMKYPRPISLHPITPINLAESESNILLQSLYLNSEHILSA